MTRYLLIGVWALIAAGLDSAVAAVRLVRVQHQSHASGQKSIQEQCADLDPSDAFDSQESSCDGSGVFENEPAINFTANSDGSSSITRDGADADVRRVTITLAGSASFSASVPGPAMIRTLGGGDGSVVLELDAPTDCTITWSRSTEVAASNTFPNQVFAGATVEFLQALTFSRTFPFDTDNGGLDNGILETGTLQPGTVTFRATAAAQLENGGFASSGQASVAMIATITFGPPEIRWDEPAGGEYADAENWDPQRVPVHNAERSDTAILGLSTAQPIPIDAGGATAGRWRVENSSIRTSGNATLFATSASDPSLTVGPGSIMEHTSGTLSSVNTVVKGDLKLSGGAQLQSDTLALVAPDSATAPRFTLVGGATPTRANLGDLRIERGSLTATGRVEIALDGPLTLGAGDADPNAVTTLTLGEALAPAVSKPRHDVRALTSGEDPLPDLPGMSKPILQPQLPPGPLVETHLIKLRDGETWVVRSGSVQILPRGALKGGRTTDSGGLVIGDGGSAEISLEGGTAQVEGELPQLVWGLGDITIGQHSQGTLRVIDGGQVELRGLVLVGDQAPGTVIVSGTSKTTPPKPSFVKFGIDLVIGNKQRGEVTVTAGADVTIVRNLLVGALDRAGSGKLVVSGGARVFASNGAIVGHETGTSLSTIELCGTNAQGDEGTLDLSSGPLSEPSTLKVKQSGKVIGKGRIIGNPFMEGRIKPGCSPGVLTIEGDYEQTEEGVLEIEVGGTQEGQFDVLHVTGDAILAGRVELTFIDGFVPKPRDSVNFMQVDGTITGKLTGSTLVDVPSTASGDPAVDPQAAPPVAQAEIKWEVTSEGTCKLTVTDVRMLDAAGNPLPPDCGVGLCGAGVMPMAPLTLLGLAGICCGRRRRLRQA